MKLSNITTFIIVALITLSSLMVGCTKSQESKSKTETKVIYENKQEYTKMFSMPEAQEAAKNAKLKCEADRTCSEQVGMLTYAFPFENGAAVGRCTFFVVSEDIILTNRHCIPQYFIDDTKNITNKMFAIFSILEKQKNVAIEIKEIISLSTELYSINKYNSVFSMDYAFLRLNKKISAKPLELSRKGLPSELPLYVISINPIKLEGAIGGEMVLRLCSVIYNTIAIPSFNNEFRPVSSFTDCDIVSGNSGSPAIDEKGKVRAIINGTSTNSSVHHLAFGNNMACVHVPKELNLTNELNSECEILPDSEAARKEWMEYPVMSGSRINDFFSKFNVYIEYNGNNINPKFKWQTSFIKSESELEKFLNEKIFNDEKRTMFLSMKPECVNKENNILFKIFKSNKLKTFNFKIPIWSLKVFKNDFSQNEMKSNLVKEVEVKMAVQPVKSTKMTKVVIKVIQDDMPKVTLFDEEIAQCQ